MARPPFQDDCVGEPKWFRGKGELFRELFRRGGNSACVLSAPMVSRAANRPKEWRSSRVLTCSPRSRNQYQINNVNELAGPVATKRDKMSAVSGFWRESLNAAAHRRGQRRRVAPSLWSHHRRSLDNPDSVGRDWATLSPVTHHRRSWPVTMDKPDPVGETHLCEEQPAQRLPMEKS